VRPARTHHAIAYIFAAIILLIALSAIESNLRLRRIRLGRKGKGFTREEFVEAFRQIDIPDDIPAAVYGYYRSQKGWEDFPFLPDDEYSKVLYDDPDDLDEDALALIKCLGMVMLPEYILRGWGDKPIKTLHDMVIWLDWVRQHQPGNRSMNPSLQSF
jgi:hypothetical protein